MMNETPAIDHWIRINEGVTMRDGRSSLTLEESTPEEAYRMLQSQYPKFFKMDTLCKWAWIGTEYLLQSEGGKFLYEGIDKTKVAVVLMTNHGCLDVDKKYLHSTLSIASPALFVYTLPNIMLGELCIRHGFKGEQACLVSERFDSDELHFWVADLLLNRGMEACLCGWVDVLANEKDVCLFWITKKGEQVLTPAALQQCY